MATNNAVNTSLSGSTGTGNFVGSISPTLTGTTTLSTTNTSALNIQNAGSSASETLSSYINSTTSSNIRYNKSRSTVIGSFTTVQSGDAAGNISFFGDDGTQFSKCGSIQCVVTGTVSTGIVPGQLLFNTTNSSGVSTLSMYIDSNSRVYCLESIVTQPANSQSSSLAVASNYHNTAGYDILLTVYMSVTSATSASILLGVGSVSSPSQQTIVAGLTLASLGIIPIPIYIPANYYALLSTSGTIVQTISGQILMPI